VKKDNEKQAVLWWPLVIEKVQTIKKKSFLNGRLCQFFVLYKTKASDSYLKIPNLWLYVTVLLA
jgi:hypothetical protein